jgi:alpha-beta hydrolase superfamily lysophospholipase
MAGAPLTEPYFNYFPDHYRWSHGLLMALGAAPYGGAEIGEVHAVGQALSARMGDDHAWFDEWCTMADRLRAAAQEHLAQGRTATAASYALRACNYFQIGERFAVTKDDAALDAYRRSLDCFGIWVEHGSGPSMERVEVPFEGDVSLPAYLVQPDPGTGAGGPAPCVVFFDGLDITKELQYLRGVAEFSRRGIACLIVDGPGNGESSRFRGQYLRYDYDVAGTAALDFLAGRPEIDPQRVAVMGISLGGYFAPRCAAKDQRFAACVAWGAIWDYHQRWSDRIAAGFNVPLSVAGEHIAWALGAESPQAALELLRDWRLQGVAKDIRVPFLILHGEDDQQVPLHEAQALLDEASSTDKTLKIYPKGEPGAQHCQVDGLVPAIQDIADWLVDKLRP